jgi:hypothetical protein
MRRHFARRALGERISNAAQLDEISRLAITDQADAQHSSGLSMRLR